METRWEPGEFVLKFRLGEFILFRYAFPALVCQESFLAIPPALSLQTPEFELEQHGLDVAFIRSCPLAGPLPRLSRVGDCIRGLQAAYRHFYIVLQGTFEEYLSAFHARTRATILRKVRKFEKLYGPDKNFRESTTPDEIAEFWPHAREISAATFQERMLGQGLPGDPEFQSTIDTLARLNGVRGYLLFAGSRPVSYVFGPVLDNRIFLYDFVGYDPAFAELSPGIVLQYYIIRRLFQERRLEVYDLCVGEGEHKRIFANACKTCGDILYFKASPKYLTALVTHLLLQTISRLVVTTFDRLDLKSTVKKKIRSRFSGYPPVNCSENGRSNCRR
jgi:hypothetical protein